MSWMECPQAAVQAAEADAVELAIVPRTSDIGGFEVRRALPSRQRRMVGPFVFFDQMGPSRMAPGHGLDVRPHPHIGLATITYLFTGEILHRDSLGHVQPIRPGELNWMTAGRGIVHSERTPEALRPEGPEMSGIQTWIALPVDQEETDPEFIHHDESDLPHVEDKDWQATLISGSHWGKRSPVKTFTETLYADVVMQPGARVPIDAEVEERALYLYSGTIDIGGQRHEDGQLLVLRPGDAITVRAIDAARVMLVGGEPMDGPRHIWWNFVSSRRERIEQAKDDWRAGRFEPVIDESEFIPLPEN